MSGGLIVFKSNWRIGVVTICGSSLMGLVPVTVADAANPESVTVDMTFLDAITITENNPLQFGLLDVNMANNQVVRVRPNGNVVDNAGGDTACGGPGYSETSVGSSTLLVGLTLVGTGNNGLAGAADGSFAVTISYQ